jgi:alpha-D-ribose 1-methylphosphonate 5-triphosphate synthase subunit PhnG
MTNSGYAVFRDFDYVVCEADLDQLRSFVENTEKTHAVEIVKYPSACLAMLRAQDSLEAQEFYLGEALTTECEVRVNGAAGFGLCLGDEPQRCYCIAVLDALHEHPTRELEDFIESQRHEIARREQNDFSLIERTRVDFKLMEEV